MNITMNRLRRLRAAYAQLEEALREAEDAAGRIRAAVDTMIGLEDRRCPVCGIAYTPYHGRQIACSPKHSRTIRNQRNKTRREARWASRDTLV